MEFIFDPSLMLYLPLYELDGASFRSKDTYGHLGTVSGAAWRLDGHYFDGIDDVINLGNPAALNLGSAWTVEGWVKAEAVTPHQGIVTKSSVTNRDFALVILDTGVLCLLNYVANIEKYVTSTATIDDSTWHHVVGINDGTDLSLFIDSGADGVGSGQGGSTDNDGEDFKVGHWRTNEFLKGTIGEVRVYNRALSPLEIQHNYLSTKWRYR